MDHKYTNIQHFEQKLRLTFWLAFLAGLLHKAVKWLSGATLTWATVVLMGGFSSDLPISDLFTITLLVILIIVLLAIAILTCKLVTKKSLSTGSLHPLQLTYSDKRLAFINAIKLISFLVQSSLLIFIVSISLPYIQGIDLHSIYSYAFSKGIYGEDQAHALASLRACLQSCTTDHHFAAASALQGCVQFCIPAQNSTSTGTTNLQACLFTFHALVTATCFVALLCNAYIFIRTAEACWLLYSGRPKTLSLTRYHDEVLSRVLHIGLVEADEFDAIEFLLRGIGEDLAVRNIAPLEVKRQNEDFIKYLFYHPKGVELVMGKLASEDTLLQQMAANMPGFWSSECKGRQVVLTELLSALGEKLGMPGKVAEGAANSFKALAIEWKDETPSPLFEVYVSRSGGSGQRTSGGMSSHMLPLVSGEVGMEGGGESMDEVSRSGGEGGGGGAAGNGGDGAESRHVPASSGSIELMRVKPTSEAVEKEGSGTSDACQTVATPGAEGEGPSHSQADGKEGATSERQGAGAGSAEDSSGAARSGSGSSREGEYKCNVVQKVVDLVVNKRLPTLQVYVRALDAFFMSASVRAWLHTEERQHIKRKLLRLAQGNATQASMNTQHQSVAIDSGAKVRTRLLAFSALDRFGRDPQETWRGQDLLQHLDMLLTQVPERSVIWIDEVERYKELCEKYAQPQGEWLASGKWEALKQIREYGEVDHSISTLMRFKIL